MQNRNKLGLALSGGGAKGAYHLGVIRAINQLKIKVDAISGASIGALNGSLLASAPNLTLGLEQLEEVWQSLEETSPIQANLGAYLKLLVNTGKLIAPKTKSLQVLSLFTNLYDSALLSDKQLSNLIDKHLDFAALKTGLPLYISVFPSLGSANDLTRSCMAALGLQDTPKSEFIHLQTLEPKEQKKALLASAALPLLFQAREINGKKYSDGGQGGWFTSQGNIPIQPLIDVGCNKIIAVHFNDKRLFSTSSLLTSEIIEIKPQAQLTKPESKFSHIKDLLSFDAARVKHLMEQGYKDALSCLS